MSSNNNNLLILKEKVFQLIVINKELLLETNSITESNIKDIISQLTIAEVLNLINKIFIIKKIYLVSKEIDSHEQEILNFLSNFIYNFINNDGFYSVSNRTTDVSKV